MAAMPGPGVGVGVAVGVGVGVGVAVGVGVGVGLGVGVGVGVGEAATVKLSDDEKKNPDRKSTRLNSSHSSISYAVFCLKKKKKHHNHRGAVVGLEYHGLDHG